MWILRAFDPLRNPIVPRRSFLFKLQNIRFTGILTGNDSSNMTERQPAFWSATLFSTNGQDSITLFKYFKYLFICDSISPYLSDECWNCAKQGFTTPYIEEKRK